MILTPLSVIPPIIGPLPLSSASDVGSHSCGPSYLKIPIAPTLRPIAASPVHRLAAVRAMRNEQYYSLGNLLMLHRKGTEAGAFFSAARDNDPSPETQCLDQCGVPARLGKVAHPYALHAAFCCPLLS